MGELADIAKKRNPYLTLEANESIVAEYAGYKMVASSFDPEKENYRFLLKVEVDDEIQTKYWDTGSNRIALVFDKCKKGDKVKITKTVEPSKSGGRDNITYEVEPLNDVEAEVEKATSEDEE